MCRVANWPSDQNLVHSTLKKQSCKSLINDIIICSSTAGIEIDDEQAEKIFTANDAIAFLSKEMGVH